jgi:hypothetical protein
MAYTCLTLRVLYATMFYGLVALLLFVWKPPMLFTPDGMLRRQGLMHNETMFSFGTICLALAVLSYYLFTAIDVVCDATL